MKNQSSIYAISQLKQAETLIRRIIWFLFLIVGVIGCSYQIYKFLQVYLTYPLVVTLQEKHEPSLEFPAITICNINRMKQQYDGCRNRDILHRGCIKGRDGSDPRKPVSGMKLTERRYALSCGDLLNGILSQKRIDLIKFLKRYMAMDFANQQTVGFQGDEFIKYCSFEGHVCSSKNFTLFQSLKYGNCYTFNKLTETQKVFQTSSIGYNSGLELVLDVNFNQYMRVTPSIGAHVLIHDPEEIPIPDDSGVNISPGFSTSIALKQVIMHRLPSPYRDHCRDYRTSGPEKNKDECLKGCLQKKSYESCGCADPTLPFKSDLEICNMFYEEDVCCLDQVQDQIVAGESICDCPLACFSKYYEQQLSKSIWPSKEFMKFREKYISDENMRYYRKSSIRLKIYYSSLKSKEYRQVPMFDSSEIFSNLGGQFGLWIGFSLFAFFELVEALLHVCHYIFSNRIVMKFK